MNDAQRKIVERFLNVAAEKRAEGSLIMPLQIELDAIRSLLAQSTPPREPTEAEIDAEHLRTVLATIREPANAHYRVWQFHDMIDRATGDAAPDSAAPRPCTCHPDDNPPRPCPQKYALTECRAAAVVAAQAEQFAREHWEQDFAAAQADAREPRQVTPQERGVLREALKRTAEGAAGEAACPHGCASIELCITCLAQRDARVQPEGRCACCTPGCHECYPDVR